MEELISVVIPAYNIAGYICDCVESVCRQTYTNIEIIVVDDGSTDSTYSICQELAKKDDRVILLSQKNQGVTIARETGIKKAKGKYLFFIDGDDWIDDTMLENMKSKMADADLISVGVFQEQAKDCIVRSCDRFVNGIYEKTKELDYLYSNMIYDQERDIFCPMTPWIYNKLYLRDKACQVYKKVDKRLTFGEDSAFLYLYMLSCNKIVINDSCYYHYRYREDSSFHKDDSRILSKIEHVYENLYPIFNKYPEYDLLFQLQKWVQIHVCVSISGRMGFDHRVYIPRYIADMSKLIDKDIVLYGAGKAGQDIYRQLKTFDYKVVLWIDKNFKSYEKKGFLVDSLQKIFKQSFDILYIAVESKEMASEICRELTEAGVEKGKIMWNPLLKLY